MGTKISTAPNALRTDHLNTLFASIYIVLITIDEWKYSLRLSIQFLGNTLNNSTNKICKYERLQQENSSSQLHIRRENGAFFEEEIILPLKAIHLTFKIDPWYIQWNITQP